MEKRKKVLVIVNTKTGCAFKYVQNIVFQHGTFDIQNKAQHEIYRMILTMLS